MDYRFTVNGYLCDHKEDRMGSYIGSPMITYTITLPKQLRVKNIALNITDMLSDKRFDTLCSAGATYLSFMGIDYDAIDVH